jgi:hypothetical protein
LFRKVLDEFDERDFKVKSVYSRLASLFKLNIEKESEPVYVRDHLSFLDREGSLKYKYIGEERIRDVIINVLFPLVLLYADTFDKKLLEENVSSLYSSLKIRTDNSILKVINNQILKSRKIQINTPATEQAAIQLYNFYCMRGRCLECKIGQKLFSDKGYQYQIIFY